MSAAPSVKPVYRPSYLAVFTSSTRNSLIGCIPVFYLVTVAILTGVYGAVMGYPSTFPLYHLFAGGLMIGAFFMATDWVTSPITKKGKIIYAIGLGVLTSLIRLRGSYTEGVCYSILMMNMVTPMIDRFVRNVSFGGGLKK